MDVPESARADEGERVFAALGDSFMSGEGADVYFKGTNTRRVNECRRAPSAYAAKLAAESGGTVPTDVIFVACSGAKARHIYVDAQHPGEPVDGPEGGLPQLANLDHQLSTAELDKGHVALVLLSIGGNDSLFGDIAQTCVRPGNCAELGQAWLTNLARMRGILLDTYDAVHLAFRDTPVVVVPYPIPIDRDTVCTYSTFTPEEHRFLHGFTEQLNSVIRAAAAERRFYVLEEMELALDRDQLCDGGEDEVGVNFVAANGVDGLFEQQADPRNWFHNSMHPNERGHGRMTAVAREWIAANPDLPSRADTATPPSVAPPTDVGDECVDADDLDDCAAMWTAGELARYLTFPGVLWVALVIGAWLVALAFIRWWRRELQRWFTERFGPRWRSVRQAVGVTVQD